MTRSSTSRGDGEEHHVLAVSQARLLCRSERFEEGEELVGGLVAPGFGGGWFGAGERAFFDGHVGVEVDLGGLDLFVAEPESDHGGVDAGVEEAHRGGVAQDVWGDVLVVQGRAGVAAAVACGGESARDRVAGERVRRGWWGTADRRAGRRVRRASARRAVAVGLVSGVIRSLRPLPWHATCAAGGEVDVGDREAGELGDAQAGLDRELEHRSVATADPGAGSGAARSASISGS